MINGDAEEPGANSLLCKESFLQKSNAPGQYERLGLLQKLQRNMVNAQRLQQQSATIKQELRELLQGLNRPARRRFQSANKSVERTIVNFPGPEFTIEDLERANASVDPAVVRFQLGLALSHRGVEFILPDEYNGSAFKTVRYRKTCQSIRRFPYMNGFAQNGH